MTLVIPNLRVHGSGAVPANILTSHNLLSMTSICLPDIEGLKYNIGIYRSESVYGHGYDDVLLAFSKRRVEGNYHLNNVYLGAAVATVRYK